MKGDSLFQSISSMTRRKFSMLTPLSVHTSCKLFRSLPREAIPSRLKARAELGIAASKLATVVCGSSFISSSFQKDKAGQICNRSRDNCDRPAAHLGKQFLSSSIIIAPARQMDCAFYHRAERAGVARSNLQGRQLLRRRALQILRRGPER